MMLFIGTALAHCATAYLAPSAFIRPAVSTRSRPVLATEQQTQQRGPGLPFFQQDVPADQQPIAELRTLKQQPFFDWPASDDYAGKLRELYFGINVFLSLPIAYTTYYNIPQELPNLLLAANLGTLFIMLPFVLRLRFGWYGAERRLKDRSIYYEAQQTGLFARKDKESQMRDRLIAQQEVRPILRKLDVSIAALVVAFFLSIGGGEALVIAQGDAAPATLKTLSGDDAMRFTNRLRSDPEFARREQERAQARGGGENLKPVYCDSRYYKILAGGNAQGGVGCGD